MGRASLVPRAGLIGLFWFALLAHGALYLRGDAPLGGLMLMAMVLGLVSAWLSPNGPAPAALLPLPGTKSAPPRSGSQDAKLWTRPEAWLLLPGNRRAWWVTGACWLGLILAVALVVWGALATGPRSWDALVAWEFRAQALAVGDGLRHPVFAEHAVYSHSRGYPLLLPQLLAATAEWVGYGNARAVHAGLFALLLATVWWVARGLRLPTLPASLLVFAAGLMPAWIDPGGGSADSGYADLLVAVLLTGAGVAWVLRDHAVLACCCGALVVAKPEGLPQALTIVLLAWVFGWWRGLGRSAWVVLAMLWLWFPLRSALLHPGDGWPVESSVFVVHPAWGALWLVIPMGGAITLLAGMSRRWGWTWRLRGTLCLVGAGSALGALFLGWLGGAEGALGQYLDPAGLGGRLGRLPRVLAGFAEHAVGRGKLAALLPWFFSAALCLRVRGIRQAGGGAAVLLGILASIALASVALAPEENLEHHIRSSMGRLLAQLAPLAAVLAGLWTFQVWVGDCPEGQRAPQDGS